MSRLARKIATITLVLLVIQFVGAIVIQFGLSHNFRAAMVGYVYRSIEGSGVLTDCAARPGPWAPPVDDGSKAWPVSADGKLIGEDRPLQYVELPPPGEASNLGGDRIGEVYASVSPGCGGIVLVRPILSPAAESHSLSVATLGLLRILLSILVGVALVSLTAVPLVRRIRALSDAMGRIVEARFGGAIEDSSQDELGDVARAFNAATASVREQLERLEHRDAVLRRGLADFAHDLRTPLTTLQLFASGLPPSTTSAKMRSELSYVQGLMRNFESVLVDDVPGELVAVDLNQLVERVQHRFAPLAKDRNPSFEVALPDEGLHTRADSIVLERALSNLVHNALRFARAHVVVLLFRAGDEVRLEVRDDGPGFGLSLERAAERGVRGDDGSGVGLGLGLAIAEAAARRFGGRLELRDDADGSTLAALVLPIASES